MRTLIISHDTTWCEEAVGMLETIGCSVTQASTPPEEPPNIDQLQLVELLVVHLESADTIPSWIPVTSTAHVPVLICSSSTPQFLPKLGEDLLEVFAWPPTVAELRLRVTNARDRRKSAELEQELRTRSIQLERQTQDVFEAWAEASFAHEEAEVANEELKEMDANKTHFFRNISHELRTPLTLILSPLESAMCRHPSDPDLSVVDKNARRLLHLVNQLLDLQRLTAGHSDLVLVPVDLVRFVHTCSDYIRATCRSKGINLRQTLDGEPLPATGDNSCVVEGEVDGLEKIIFNLLFNAIKHSPEGGSIEFGLRRSPGQVTLFVSDSGKGIPIDRQDRLFRIFSRIYDPTTQRMTGTGLGLALVKELTEAMGGEVGVKSAEGEGSTFLCILNRAPGDQPVVAHERTRWEFHDELVETSTDETTLVVEKPEALVLVVDDLPDMQRMLVSRIVEWNYAALSAGDGETALELARQHRPDLIIADWLMPRMDGLELIQALKKDPKLASIPVILLTARSDDESRLLGTTSGADAFLGKPFNTQELQGIVRNLLTLKAREREVEMLNRKLSEDVLKRYLPPDLVEDIIQGRLQLDHPPRKLVATVLFSDLVEFTRLTSELKAERMAHILNEYLTRMNDIIFEHRGTVDKFIGDAIMVLFGAPHEMRPDEQARRAAECAKAMQAGLADLNAHWTGRFLIRPLQMRIGIHQGPMIVGNYGSKRRYDYTAIGPAVNLASRIESSCKPGGGLISQEVAQHLPEDQYTEAGSFEFKGIDEQIPVFHLL
jgi:signal transduction histidine kinase/class 3 adenylate cyclase